MQQREFNFEADAVIVLSSQIPHFQGPPNAPSLNLNHVHPGQRLEVTKQWLSQYIYNPSQRLAFCHGESCGACRGKGCKACDGSGEIATEEHKAIITLIAQHYGKSRVDHKTIEVKAGQWGENILRNLKRRAPFATSMGEPFVGVPAFIVSAGPSLDDNGHLLPHCNKRGLVFAVNTSATAVQHHGAEPDVVMCSETRDVSHGLEATPNAVHGVDLIAGEANWETPGRKITFSTHEPFVVPMLLELGTRPLNYGGSVATAAASLALLWGCNPIVLVGQDLAYTGGKMYAQGTPYQDMKALYRNGRIEYEGESKKMDPAFVAWVESWGGDKVHTIHGLLQPLAWFESLAARHTLINATGGGARIHGALEMDLGQVLTLLPERQVPPIPEGVPCDPEPLFASIRKHAQEFLDKDEGLPVPSADFPLLWLWSTSVTLKLNREVKDARQRVEAMREELRGACRTMLEVIG